MRVLMLTRGDETHPSSRLRFYRWVPWLNAAGHEVVIRPLFDSAWMNLRTKRDVVLRTALKAGYALFAGARRTAALLDADRFDLVVIEQQLFPYEQGLLERVLHAHGTPYLIEFDDAIYLQPGHAAKMKAAFRRADLVIAGNRTLAAFAREANAEVAIVPTTIDGSRVRPMRERQRAREPGRRFVVGWVGLPFNLKSLTAVAQPLHRLFNELNAEGVRLELQIVSSEPVPVPGVPTRFVPWTLETEYESIAGFDVGVMPLADTPYERGKCAYKLLQYMAAGVPAVGSPVGMNNDVVRNGENGFLCGSEKEWYATLRALALDPAQRRRVGDAGARTVDEGFDAAIWGPRMVHLYERTAAAGFRRRRRISAA